MGPVLIANPRYPLFLWLATGLALQFFAAEAAVTVAAANREPSATSALPGPEVGVLLGSSLLSYVLH
jgi:vancomycin permeability regulator SanA